MAVGPKPTSVLTLEPSSGNCSLMAQRPPTSGSFKKGQSGNPKGRPKALGEVMELARKRTAQTINRLVYWSEQDGDPQVSLRATIALHEIAWGKPTQAVQHQNGEGGPLEIILSWKQPAKPPHGQARG